MRWLAAESSVCRKREASAKMPWRGSSQTLLTALAIAAISQSVSASSENTVPDSSGNCSSSVEVSVDQRAEALDRWRHSRSIQRHGATYPEGSPRTGGSSKAANTETWRDRYRNLQTGMRDAFKKAFVDPKKVYSFTASNPHEIDRLILLTPNRFILVLNRFFFVWNRICPDP